ncbi:MAG: hypothetical protein KDE26_30670, partial [Bacteroidetes bacterium]|nr:hypothetical protein [Bacteroidota bacterium]
MNPFPKIYPIIILSIITLWSCKSESPSQKDIIASGYPDDVATILLTNCAIPTCHEGAAAEQNLDLSTWNGLFSGSEHGAVVIPFSAEWSPLFLHINTFTELGPKSTPTMPTDNAEPLSMLDVSAMKDWIQNGALN